MATTFLVVLNNATGQLDAGISDSATSLTLGSGEGASFPSSFPFHISINNEIIEVGARSSDVLSSLVRAREDTSAAAHSASDAVELRMTAKIIDDITEAVNALETGIDHGGLDGLADDDHGGHPWLAGRSGGQTLKGDTASGGALTLESTAHATKGKILFGNSAYDEAANLLGLGETSPYDVCEVVTQAGGRGLAVTDGSNYWLLVNDYGISSLGKGTGVVQGHVIENTSEVANTATYLIRMIRRTDLALNTVRFRIASRNLAGDSDNDLLIIEHGPLARVQSVAWEPLADATYDFGTSDNRWKDGYFSGTIRSASAPTSIQVGGSINIGTDAAAADDTSLDLTHTDRVLLLNRLTTTQRNALTPISGHWLYNTTLGKFQAYENGAWVDYLTPAEHTSIGDSSPHHSNTDDHPQAHTLASHSTKPHSALSDAPTSAHHVKYADSDAIAAVGRGRVIVFAFPDEDLSAAVFLPRPSFRLLDKLPAPTAEANQRFTVTAGTVGSGANSDIVLESSTDRSGWTVQATVNLDAQVEDEVDGVFTSDWVWDPATEYLRVRCTLMDAGTAPKYVIALFDYD